MRPPLVSSATTRIWCATTEPPASHEHSKGWATVSHTCFPSTKNRIRVAAFAGVRLALSVVAPLMYASAEGERIWNAGATSAGACARAGTAAREAAPSKQASDSRVLGLIA